MLSVSDHDALSDLPANSLTPVIPTGVKRSKRSGGTLC